MQSFRWKIAQFFEKIWWKWYLRKKDKTAYLIWKKAYWNGFLEKAGITVLPNQKILDCGCGPAGIFIILDDFHPDALDPLVDFYAQQIPHFDKADWPGTRFITTPLENYKTERPYDLIFCLNVINHVADIGASIDRLVAMLAPGGRLLLSVDAHNYPLFKWVMQRIPGDILHPHQYDFQEYSDMLTKRGLQTERRIPLKKEFIFSYELIIARKPD